MARMRKTTTELSIYYQPYILIGMNIHSTHQGREELLLHNI